MIRNIDFNKKEERLINGMYYVSSFPNLQSSNEKDKKFYLVMHPKHYVVKPVLDYLRSKFKRNLDIMKRIASSLCHFYNFLRLHRLNGEDPISDDILDAFIKYLAFIPKNLPARIRSRMTGGESKDSKDRQVKLHEIKYLPVHPYIDGQKSVSKILNEWLRDYWSVANDKPVNVKVFFNPRNQFMHQDEWEWRYTYEYIRTCINDTLDYLDYLSKSEKWNHRYKLIDVKVAEKTERFHEKRGTFYSWDVESRIKDITSLKPGSQRTEQARVFFESELRKLLNSKMLKKYPQRKLLFVLLLLAGTRISETLNLLVRNVNISFPKNALTKEELKNGAVIHWEDMFKGLEHNSDIFINEHLNFGLRIVKRPSYEAAGRKNKTKKSRFPILRDYFEFPKIIGEDCDNIFIKPKDIVKCFYDDMVLTGFSDNSSKFIQMVMHRHYDHLSSGILISDSRNYNHEVKRWIEKIRGLIESCWFGQLLREYLIERALLLSNLKFDDKAKYNKHYLFVNFKNNKGNAMLPNTIRSEWLNKICEEERISRYRNPQNSVVRHAKKADLTIHSFRHTYISMRINHEVLKSQFSQINLATLKRDVGHIPTSTVAETIYYFGEIDETEKIYTKVFADFKDNLHKVVFHEQGDYEGSEETEN